MLKNDNQEVLKNIKLNVLSRDTIRNVISQSVDKFNNLLYNEGKLITLKDDYSMYRLRQAKKSGYPDLELPCIIK